MHRLFRLIHVYYTFYCFCCQIYFKNKLRNWCIFTCISVFLQHIVYRKDVVFMIMGCIITIFTAISCLAAFFTGSAGALASSVVTGAGEGITLALSLAGSLCLWTGVGKLMEAAGLTAGLSRLLSPLLARIFPSTKSDPVLASHLSANICANFLGLGNAATPMGLKAVQHMAKDHPGVASDEMCRLIVLNSASIQLIPATVAAIRAGLGAQQPFELLPAVWITSLCSASAGVAASFIMGKVLHDH